MAVVAGHGRGSDQVAAIITSRPWGKGPAISLGVSGASACGGLDPAIDDREICRQRAAEVIDRIPDELGRDGNRRTCNMPGLVILRPVQRASLAYPRAAGLGMGKVYRRR